MILSMKSPDTNPLLSCASMLPPDEFTRRNPTWGQAIKGPDREKCLAADEAEKKQHFETKKTSKHFQVGERGFRGVKEYYY